MLKQFTNRLSGISPRVAIIGALILIVGVSGVALLLTRGAHHAEADTSVKPYAARIDSVEGSVGIAQAANGDKELDWTEATLNTPVSVGDRIYARDNSRASIALTGRDYVQLSPATAVDVLSLEDARTQLALRSGSALFDVGALETNDLYEVATPCGAVHFTEPGLYQIGMDGENAIISVLTGVAQVVGQDGYIGKGQMLTLVGAVATQALASRLAPQLAGNIVDGYYRDRYANTYDGRYQNYDAYLEDPFYYDPYQSSISSQYLSADIPGVYELDSYGDWVEVNNYGRCWAPRVSSGWAPFRAGRWDLDALWGPSWVSSEPWGWAPYHYGRWASVNQQWFWVPGELRTRHDYCPAAVAFIPFENDIAWLPLGPGEAYVPRYYDESFQPRYLASQEVINVVTAQRNFLNFNAPGAVTVVPVRSLDRVIGPGFFTTGDPRTFANSRSVIDPYAVQGIRELAIRRDDGRRRLKFAREEQDIFNRSVVASARPEAWRVRSDLTRTMKAEVSPERQRKNKLKINDTGEVASARRGDGLPQSSLRSQETNQRMGVLAARAEQGDKSARREMRQLMRQEQAGQQQQAAPQQAQQQEQSRQQMKQQRRAERQQQVQPGQPQAQQERQQMKQQRRAERQQQAGQPQAQQEQSRQQMKQQRRAERQQQQAGQPQAQQEQLRQQRRQQKQKPPQTPQAMVQQPQAERQQAKAQRRAEQQRQIREQNTRAAAQSVQQSQAREQMKTQRHAQQRAVQQSAQQNAMIQEQNRRAAVQSAQAAQARQQMKAQRRADQRPVVVDQNRAQAQAAPQAQVQQQMKIQRRAERQAAAVPQQAAPNSAAPSDKAQRKAERQRRPPQ